MEIDYGGSAIFTASTMDTAVWSKLAVGDYIAVNTLMLKMRPNFYLQPALPGPLNLTQVNKFANNRQRPGVFEDGTFISYRVMALPRPGSGVTPCRPAGRHPGPSLDCLVRPG